MVCLLRLGGLGVLCSGRPVWGSIHCMGGCSLLGSRMPSNTLPDPERLRRVAGLCSGAEGEDSIVVVVLGRVTGGAASDEPLRRVTTDMAVDEVPLPRLGGTSSGEDLDRSPVGDHQAGKTLYGSPWFPPNCRCSYFLATRGVLTTPAPCGSCCVVKNECTERKLDA